MCLGKKPVRFQWLYPDPVGPTVVAWTVFWQYPQNMEQVIDLLIANAFLVQINIHVLAILFVTHPNKYNYFIGCLIKIIFTNNLSYAIIIIIIICDWNSLCIYWDIYIMSLNIICVCSINYVLKKDKYLYMHTILFVLQMLWVKKHFKHLQRITIYNILHLKNDSYPWYHPCLQNNYLCPQHLYMLTKEIWYKYNNFIEIYIHVYIHTHIYTLLVSNC